MIQINSTQIRDPAIREDSTIVVIRKEDCTIVFVVKKVPGLVLLYLPALIDLEPV